jgi:ferredoxin
MHYNIDDTEFTKEEFPMPRRITEDCIACAACVAECPVDCISEGDIYVIDEDVCIDCGACEVVCPVDAIIEV